jgi:uncharacterized membrane protein
MAQESLKREMITTPRSDGAKLQKLSKKDIAQVCRYLVEDALFLEEMQARMRNMTLHPALVQMVWNYAYGKPKERVEIRKASVVKIIHQFAGEAIEAQVVKADDGE